MKNVADTITESSVVVATTQQVSSDLSEDVVILNLKSGVYCSLNPIGAKVWSLIQAPKPVSEIFTDLMNEYDVDAETCNRDLLALLHDMSASGLIEVSHGTDA